MNEQEGIMDEFFNNEMSDITDNSFMEGTEENGEIGENPQETTENGASEYGTDTGEVLETESAHSEEILAEIQKTNEYLEELITIKAQQQETLFEKRLEEYTATEGMILCILLAILTALIFGMVGGIIKWRK